MITLHVFNPEHDIALASHLEHFTAPHAGRQLRHDLGFLPVLWALPGDYVLVEEKDAAKEGLRRLGLSADSEMIDPSDLEALAKDINIASSIKVSPWGWDIAIRHDLIQKGVSVDKLPTNAWLNTVRMMSHRAWASSHLLKPLRQIGGTAGESFEMSSLQEVQSKLNESHELVIKAPWSSSGRGVRYVKEMTPQLEGWINNVILRQGSIMVEPYYNKVYDFGMEFFSKSNGEIVYKGLSVFQTTNGAYTGNILDDEEHKMALLCQLAPMELLTSIKNKIKELLSTAFTNSYAGPFGVDMMIVREGRKLMIHPCVELNLRMTMGHIGLLIAEKYHLEEKVMRITYNGDRYSMRLETL